MIPEKLKRAWHCHMAKEEVSFLAARGGGYPYVLAAEEMTPTSRRVLLGRLGFHAAEEYVSAGQENRYGRPALWMRLTNGVHVRLDDGYVCQKEAAR